MNVIFFVTVAQWKHWWMRRLTISVGYKDVQENVQERRRQQSLWINQQQQQLSVCASLRLHPAPHMITQSVRHLSRPQVRKVRNSCTRTSAMPELKRNILNFIQGWSHVLKIHPPKTCICSFKDAKLRLSLSGSFNSDVTLYTLHWVTSTRITSAEWNICKPEQQQQQRRQQATPSSESAELQVFTETDTFTEWKTEWKWSSSREL